MKEEKGELTGLKIGYLGDLASIRFYELMRASCVLGMQMKGYDIFQASFSDVHLLKPREEADQVNSKTTLAFF
jgi:hypothetical protein